MAESLPSPTQRRAMRNAILAQCFGCVGTLVFAHGIVLVYLNRLGLPSARIVAYLAAPAVIGALVRMPGACLADRHGKKRVGYVGCTLAAAAFPLLALCGSVDGGWTEPLAVLSIVVFATGITLMSSSWFALLSPIVPEAMRGRFFGKLRFSWQLCGILFAAVLAFLLSDRSPLWVYQVVFLVVGLSMMTRLVFYARLPELEKPAPEPRAFLRILKSIVASESYVSFCAYIFLLTLFTAGAPALFGMVEKQAMQLGDNVVVWLGNLTMMGSVAGFYLGGRAVDRLGSKYVFLGCHFGYGVFLAVFLLRSWLPGPPVASVALAHLGFGLVYAASSVAVSSELLALIPEEHKSLSTSLAMSLTQAGSGLSGMFAAGALSLGVLNESWTLAGHRMSAYDTVLLAYAAMVVILVITLGLVPSVLNRTQLLPRAD